MKTACNKCNRQIKFKRLSNGKYCPVNIDGSDHWDVCNAAKSKANTYQPESSPWIVGCNYVDTKCDCLPWDGCENCSFDKSEFVLTAEQNHMRDICQL